ncbi:MAG TPA: copper resistance protein B, partial [Longimicrobiales bacterium]|nr:copper resistance protein B [Longimicrobiales bacterium]
LGATARPASGQVMDQARYLLLMADHLEQAPGLSGRPVRLEGEAWYGGIWNRLWMKLDGDADTRGGEGAFEAQALFSRMISPYWDAQIGARVDAAWGDESRSRTHLALGLQGLAPYWFEVESTLFVSSGGDVSLRLKGSYDLLLTQRLILEPDLEVSASFQDQPDWGLASGVNDTQLGLRLRWEIRRELAPYVGYFWHRSFGGTADLRRDSGLPWRDGSVVMGLRMWY